MVDDFLQPQGHQAPAFRKIRDFVVRRSFAMHGHSFIMTVAGHKGFALGEPRIGDTLFAAHGSRYPLLLRQKDEAKSRSTLVGCPTMENL